MNKQEIEEQKITYRKANQSDTIKLSILFKTVYIQTYGIDGVSDEFANFITKQFSVERLHDLIVNNPDALIVAVYKDNLVGVVEIEFEKKCPINNIVAPELNKLYILEWFCGRGIGFQLLREAENIVKLKGINEMWLWVLVTNKRAITFTKNKISNGLETHLFKWRKTAMIIRSC